MARDISHGQTAQATRGSSITTTSKGKESMCGPMEEALTGSGWTTRWKEKESSDGQMAESTSESTSRTRRKVWGISNGRMAGSTTDTGRMECSMAMDSSPIKKGTSNMGFGMGASERGGLKDETLTLR